jgi:hypothetical protein
VLDSWVAPHLMADGATFYLLTIKVSGETFAGSLSD